MSSNKSFSTETSDRYARAMLELAQENDELNRGDFLIEVGGLDHLITYTSKQN